MGSSTASRRWHAAGNSVALAAGGHPHAAVPTRPSRLPTIYVGLDCDAAELDRREGGRLDVAGGWAAASLDVHDGWEYDVRFGHDRR